MAHGGLNRARQLFGGDCVIVLAHTIFSFTDSAPRSVWRAIDEVESRAGTQGTTGALHDVYAGRDEESQAMGVVFGTEAHVGSIATTPEGAAELIEKVPGLTLTLDYAHFTKEGVRDTRIEPLVKYTNHFHVRGARGGRLQAGFEQNTIDYERVLTAMKEAYYHGWLGLEYVWTDWEHCNECDNLSESIRYRDYLRETMQTLGD